MWEIKSNGTVTNISRKPLTEMTMKHEMHEMRKLNNLLTNIQINKKILQRGYKKRIFKEEKALENINESKNISVLRVEKQGFSVKN